MACWLQDGDSMVAGSREGSCSHPHSQKQRERGSGARNIPARSCLQWPPPPRLHLQMVQSAWNSLVDQPTEEHGRSIVPWLPEHEILRRHHAIFSIHGTADTVYWIFTKLPVPPKAVLAKAMPASPRKTITQYFHNKLTGVWACGSKAEKISLVSRHPGLVLGLWAGKESKLLCKILICEVLKSTWCHGVKSKILFAGGWGGCAERDGEDGWGCRVQVDRRDSF